MVCLFHLCHATNKLEIGPPRSNSVATTFNCRTYYTNFFLKCIQLCFIIRNKKVATLYRIWLTQDQILMIAMKGHFVNEVYGKWDTVGAIWNKILLSCHFMSYVTFFPASVLRIYIPHITFPQVMKLDVVSR